MTFAVSAHTVRTRAIARPHAVPVTLASSATGVMSSTLPGGCTTAKSRYGIAPLTRRSALPNSTPSSYSVTPSRSPGLLSS